MWAEHRFGDEKGRRAALGPAECDRCGRERKPGRDRHAVEFIDRTDATISMERMFFCAECWRRVRDHLRRTYR